ncbi:MAG: hypothetical protein KatS3mg115_1800 [Candidatus Poribacteria bacterium]|nr:MAG: hypothetical protein KatS3mg115_1800 [Candidatus Poribacteria bacterium]
MLEQNYSKEIIAQFEAVAAEFPDHYLGAAAQRRAEALKRYFEEIERSYQEG